MTTATEETHEMAPSIDDYAAEQDAMTKLRAKHVGAAFAEVAGQDWKPGVLSVLVNDLDLSKFITPAGDIDTARVKALVTAIVTGSAPARQRRTSGEGGRLALERRGFTAKPAGSGATQ